MGMIHRSVFIYHICGFYPKERYLLTKNISLLDRLAYCEAALFAAKQCDKMLQ